MMQYKGREKGLKLKEAGNVIITLLLSYQNELSGATTAYAAATFSWSFTYRQQK